MASILCIETSATVCSVALCKNGIVDSFLNEYTPNSHSVVLAPIIDEILNKADLRVEELDAIAVSSGPGSYTGLRIGVSLAKGLCFRSGIPLISVPTLEIIAWEVVQQKLLTNKDSLICAMIDARRMEVYSEVYNSDLKIIRAVESEIIDKYSYAPMLEKHHIIFAGDGSKKCKNVINNKNASFAENIVPLASSMAELSYNKYQTSKFEDIAYFEPFYLKSFVATIPRKKF